MKENQKSRRRYSRTYEVLRRKEEKLHKQMNRAATQEERQNKYFEWRQVREAKEKLMQ